MCPAGHPGRCTQHAAFLVKVHAINGCNRTDIQLTDDGGLVQLCCPACMFARSKRAAQMSSQLHAVRERFGGVLECNGCGRPILDPTDFVEVRGLDEI